MFKTIVNWISNFKVSEVEKKLAADLKAKNFHADVNEQIHKIQESRHFFFNQIIKEMGRGGKTLLCEILGKQASQVSRYSSMEYRIPDEVMYKLESYFQNIPLSCFLLEHQLQVVKGDKPATSNSYLDGIILHTLNTLDIRNDIMFNEDAETFFPILLKKIFVNAKNSSGILGTSSLSKSVENLRFVISNDTFMAPEINKGDIVLFELQHGKFVGDGVYLLAFDDTLTIRRVQKISALQYRLSGNDKRYLPIEPNAKDLFFIGKVFKAIPFGTAKDIF